MLFAYENLSLRVEPVPDLIREPAIHAILVCNWVNEAWIPDQIRDDKPPCMGGVACNDKMRP